MKTVRKIKTDAGHDIYQLAHQLWEAIPAWGNAENTITLPAPLVMEILQILRRLGE